MKTKTTYIIHKQTQNIQKTEEIFTQSFINARKFSGLTQKQLSIKTGIDQSDISKIENGNANPSIRTLKRLADAMSMKLKIKFLPA